MSLVKLIFLFPTDWNEQGPSTRCFTNAIVIVEGDEGVGTSRKSRTAELWSDGLVPDQSTIWSGNFLPGPPKVIDELMGQPGFGATTIFNAQPRFQA